MNRIIRSVPNFITTLNLVSGALAVVLAAEGRPGAAGILIVIAALFDFLDGFSARLLKAYSEIGKQLDSLADVISFGVAPGALAYVLMKHSIPGLMIPMADIHTTGWNWFLLLTPFLIPVFSAWRLAKFNIDPRQSVSFLGMPTPANAMLWASFGMIYDFASNPEFPLLLFTSRNLLMTILVTSLLLVSELPMFSLKFERSSLRGNWYRYIFLGTSLLLLIFLGIYGLAVIILLYIAISVSFYLLKIRL
jgi:CDP-diacylglycerol--serine O-phosphatidyltransferase